LHFVHYVAVAINIAVAVAVAIAIVIAAAECLKKRKTPEYQTPCFLFC